MWEKLKKILQLSGGRGVIMEEGEPRYIIIPVDEYLQLKEGSGGKASEPKDALSGTRNINEGNTNAYNYAENGGQRKEEGNRPAPIDLSGINTNDVERDVDIYGRKVEEASSGNISLDDLPIRGNS